MKHFLAIDLGTSSTRAIVFNETLQAIAADAIPITTYHPQPGWVEQDPEDIWQATLRACQQALTKAGLTADKIHACGISNQRETSVIWNKLTHQTLHRAIVWQDRRTHHDCQQLTTAGYQAMIQEKTGLRCDPYFSATKLQWLLKHIDDAKTLLAKQQLAFGTLESFLLWRLTAGKVHATDITNASRTLLFNITSQQWDPSLLALFSIPQHILPSVLDSDAHFGEIDKQWLGHRIPITGMAGDQQAAAIGQACLQPGMIKATYGTGGFLLLNTGSQRIHSQHQLLTTILYRIHGKTCYGIEGSIFNAGSTIKWLRDNLGLIHTAADSETLAASLNSTEQVYFLPAFTGLGAPYWQPHALASIVGLSKKSTAAHIVRAALEAVAYQTEDILTAIEQDFGQAMRLLRVDGGMTRNRWLLQFIADILQRPVQLSKQQEATALGAALLASIGAGINTLDNITQHWQLAEKYSVKLSQQERDHHYQGWQQAMKIYTPTT